MWPYIVIAFFALSLLVVIHWILHAPLRDGQYEDSERKLIAELRKRDAA